MLKYPINETKSAIAMALIQNVGGVDRRVDLWITRPIVSTITSMDGLYLPPRELLPQFFTRFSQVGFCGHILLSLILSCAFLGSHAEQGPDWLDAPHYLGQANANHERAQGDDR